MLPCVLFRTVQLQKVQEGEKDGSGIYYACITAMHFQQADVALR